MTTPSERLQGTVDVLVLKTLAWKPMHGYAIAQFLADRSRGELAVEGAALYQGFASTRAKRSHQFSLGDVRHQDGASASTSSRQRAARSWPRKPTGGSAMPPPSTRVLAVKDADA